MTRLNITSLLKVKPAHVIEYVDDMKSNVAKDDVICMQATFSVSMIMSCDKTSTSL